MKIRIKAPGLKQGEQHVSYPPVEEEFEAVTSVGIPGDPLELFDWSTGRVHIELDFYMAHHEALLLATALRDLWRRAEAYGEVDIMTGDLTIEIPEWEEDAD